MENRAPVYVRVQEYDEVLSTLEAIKRKVREARELLAKLNELKAEEDRELLAWAEGLDDVQNRVVTLEKNLTQ